MRAIIAAAVLITLFSAILYGQEISEKKEIAVFALSYYDWRVPDGALGIVDEQIKNVFVNLGRFDVIGMNYRLAASNVNEFIGKIRDVKEQNAEIPETVRFGQEAFTEADFNKLVGSFIVVVPSLSFYEVKKNDEGRFHAKLETSFTFIDVEQVRTIGHFTIETSGTDESAREAVNAASDAISSQLTFELRQLPVFQLKTGIIDVRGSEVILEFGENMGVSIGDEYAIVTGRTLSTGHQVTDETGLIIVTEVKEEISMAKVVYAQGRANIGDQLEEIPRLGFDTTAYVRAIAGDDDASDESANFTGLIGIKQSISRGFFKFRPFIGVEVPFGIVSSINPTGGLILNFYGGAELNWYAWRLQFVPQIALGIGGNIPLEEEDTFSASHIGGFAQVTISYLLTRDWKLFADVGYGA